MGATFKRLLMPIFLLLIGGGIFIGLLAKEGIPEVIATLAAFGLAPFILYVGISLANFALYAHRWQVIVNKGQAAIAKISFFRLYLHRMSGYAFMYLLPLSFFGSEPVRVGLLHEDGVPLNRATSSVLIDLAFETMAFILFIAVGLILALVEGVTLGNAGTVVASALVLFAAVIITFYVGTVSGKGFFAPVFRFLRLHKIKRLHTTESWLKGMEGQMTEFLRDRPLLIIWLLVLSLLMISFRTFENWFIAHFLGVSLNFTQSLLSSTIPGIVLLLPVPGGLGFLEASNTGFFALLGVSINALALVLIIRLRDLVFMAIGLTHASSQIWRFLKDWLHKKTPVVDKNAVF